jgi:hypothetical protein
VGEEDWVLVNSGGRVVAVLERWWVHLVGAGGGRDKGESSETSKEK